LKTIQPDNEQQACQMYGNDNGDAFNQLKLKIILKKLFAGNKKNYDKTAKIV